MAFMSSAAHPAERQSPMVEDTDQIDTVGAAAQYPEQTISQVEPYQPMEKPTDEGGADAVVKKVVIEDGPETDAELKLKEETEKAAVQAENHRPKTAARKNLNPRPSKTISMRRKKKLTLAPARLQKPIHG